MINTHNKISPKWSGKPTEIKQNFAKVVLETNSEMLADDKGLIHGGFIFSLADYSAMLAVNKSTVVLGAANKKFLKPVILGDILKAEAKIIETKGKKITVKVEIFVKEKVFEGVFETFVPEKHILT